MDEKKPHPCPDGDVLKAGPELPGGSRPFIRHTIFGSKPAVGEA